MGKDKLSCNKQDNLIKLAKTFVTNGNMHAYENKDNECIQKFKHIVKHNLEFKQNKNFITKFLGKVQNILKFNNIENTQNYAQKLIEELINTRKLLLKPTEEFKNHKLYKNFTLALNRGETKYVATKSVLIKMLEGKTTNSRILKTIGGFIAVGLAINPIDKFVEHTIIDKYLGPQIDKLK